MNNAMGLIGLDQVRSKWGWFVGLGILLALFGFIAISHNYITTLATMLVLGWLLVVTGAIEAVSAFYVRSWSGFFFNLLEAALDLVVGYLFLVEPERGAAILTIFLACLFFVGGVFRIGAALTHRFPGWPWALFSGVINVVLGILLINQWPFDGVWFIGFCVGLELIFRGWFWMMLGFSLKQLPKTAA
jgi:uncharacterized membrane protein HdeD (DUF308 family)